MILVYLCRSIKKSNFNNNIMYNSSKIALFQVLVVIIQMSCSVSCTGLFFFTKS